MLLEMRFCNFFSIKEEVAINFVAGKINNATSKELSANVFEEKNEVLLKVLGFFGANASGKSNLFKTTYFCRDLIINSHKNNEGDAFYFKPFKFDNYSEKSSYCFINFIVEEVEYEYFFEINQFQILKESLYYYPNKRKARIFTRDETQGNSKAEIYKFTEGHFVKPFDVAIKKRKNTLFISRASQLDRELAKKIYNFFRTKLLIGLPELSSHDAVNLFTQNKDLILKVLKLADSDILDINLKNQNGLNNFYTIHRFNSEIIFNLEEESSGTIQIFRLLLPLLDVCKNNKILFIDEFDLSMHSELAQFVLELVNASKATQFIFTSHNTNLLNTKKLRKDQINFVNKKDDGSTDIYSLYEFKDFREHMDAKKCYLQGRFDSLPYINFSRQNIKSLYSQ